MKHYTSILQSKKLLELGLNPETADMYWEYNHNIHIYDDIPRIVVIKNWNDKYNKNIPCWSLGTLLEVMPTIEKDVDEYIPYFIKNSEYWERKIQPFWYCFYALLDDSNTELITFRNSIAIEAAFNMVVWLLENGYIKKEINQ